MTKQIIALIMVLSTAACATGEIVRGNVREGLSKAEVVSLLGDPDGFKRAGDQEALLYTNRLISGWSWDRTDYTVILEKDRVIEYGTGQVRQNGPNTLILVPLN